MAEIFQTLPNFDKYKGSTKNYKDEFWADPLWGGPFTDALRFEGRYIDNTIIDDMQKEWDERKEHHGYFRLKNIRRGKSGNVFEDIDVFVNELTKKDYDYLVSINDTDVYENFRNPWTLEVYPLLNGHARRVEFTANGRTKEGDDYDPLVNRQNSFNEIQESYMYHGDNHETTPTFTRRFTS
jgi:hypothetical protein